MKLPHGRWSRVDPPLFDRGALLARLETARARSQGGQGGARGGQVDGEVCPWLLQVEGHLHTLGGPVSMCVCWCMSVLVSECVLVSVCVCWCV